MVATIGSSISLNDNPEHTIKAKLQNSIKKIELENDLTYWGQIKNGIPHGYGKKKTDQGTTYQGEFVSGLEHGYGTSFGSDGEISFQGQWRKGIPLVSKQETVKDLTNY